MVGTCSVRAAPGILGCTAIRGATSAIASIQECHGSSSAWGVRASAGAIGIGMGSSAGPMRSASARMLSRGVATSDATSAHDGRFSARRGHPWNQSGGGAVRQSRVQRGTLCTTCRHDSDIALNHPVKHDHASFIQDVAKIDPPTSLVTLLEVLQAKGECIVSPSDRQGMLPLAIPLSRDPKTGDTTAFLRWPTPPEGLEMPLIRVRKENQGVQLLSKTVEEFIHRCLVEEDADRMEIVDGERSSDISSTSTNTVLPIAVAAGDLGQKLYVSGSFGESRLPSADVYITRKVGLFPDVLERLALRHLEKGDHVSALVAGEFYCSRKHFPGFGRPFGFNAELFVRIGREPEAKDAARVALRCPWWTLGSKFEAMADIAGYSDERIELLKERLTDEARQEDITKGKTPEQVSLDQAAFLLDTAAAEGNWDDIRDQLANLYDEAGLVDLAAFIKSGR